MYITKTGIGVTTVPMEHGIKNGGTHIMTEKNKQPDKQIKVPPEIHQEIKMLAAAEGREMREIVTTAFEFYKKYRNSIKNV